MSRTKSKTWSREVSVALMMFLCYLTYEDKAEVSDWITPVTMFLTVSFGLKQDAVKQLTSRDK